MKNITGINDKKVKLFTDSLYELVVEQKVSLIQSLEIMSVEKKSSFQSSCFNIKEDLLHGSSFSSALKKCKSLDFDDVYISFISFSEITGNLGETLSFLKKRCERREESREKLSEASLYPAFVIFLAVVICLFIWKYSEKIGFLTSGFSPFSSIIALFSVCVSVFLIIFNGLKENKLYEAFLAVGFLVKSGTNVSVAMGAGVIVAGPGTKNGNYFQKAKNRLEYGMDVFSAFYELQFNSELKNIFYFARIAGNKADVFEKIAVKMGCEDEKKKKRILNLVEPVFIVITGFFLLLLMVTYFIPLMTDTSWMNL